MVGQSGSLKLQLSSEVFVLSFLMRIIHAKDFRNSIEIDLRFVNQLLM